MIDTAKYLEIDITKHARALTLISLAEYVLFTLCCAMALGPLGQLIREWPSHTVSTRVTMVVITAVFSAAAYQLWRHAARIDTAAWRGYAIVLPILALFSFAVAWSIVVTFGSV